MLAFIRDLFNIQNDTEPTREDSESMRHIEECLNGMEIDRARYLAAFAFILGRIAMADRKMSAEECASMEATLQQVGKLSPKQASLTVSIAQQQQKLFGGTDNFLVVKVFAEIANEFEKLQLLDCLFAVAAADGTVQLIEEEEIRQVSIALGLSHSQFIHARLRVGSKREVMKS